MKYFITTDQGDPLPVEDVLTWAKWFETSNRKLANDDLVIRGQRVRISTVFLGLDHSFGSGPLPVLWETMIFGGEHDQFQERYTSKEAAMIGHLQAVNLAKHPIEGDL